MRAAAPAATWPEVVRTGERAELAVLASLPAMTPARLRALVGTAGPRAALAALRGGRLEGLAQGAPGGARRVQAEALLARWAKVARGLDPPAVLAAWERRGRRVLLAGDAAFPGGLLHDPSGPAVLFACGEPAPVGARVGLVGTRSSTAYGESVAAELAAGLVAAGAGVVTSLEPGIGAAACCGASGAASGTEGAPVLALAAGGADAHGPLGAGPGQGEHRWCVASEAPFGAAPERWRFARRNRLVAAASDVVVVVEAHGRGVALQVADTALGLDRVVGAVPGSVRSPSSRGTNALLADGAQVVRDLGDLLGLLGLLGLGAPGRPCPATGAPPGDRLGGSEGGTAPGEETGGAPLDRTARAVLSVVGDAPTALDAVLAGTGAGLEEVALALEGLVAAGILERVPGGYERAQASPGHRGVARRLQP